MDSWFRYIVFLGQETYRKRFFRFDMVRNAVLINDFWRSDPARRHISYLKEKGLYENIVFIITSDNGPDGGNFKDSIMMEKWQEKHGYHRDPNQASEKGYFGSIGPEFALRAE